MKGLSLIVSYKCLLICDVSSKNDYVESFTSSLCAHYSYILIVRFWKVANLVWHVVVLQDSDFLNGEENNILSWG